MSDRNRSGFQSKSITSTWLVILNIFSIGSLITTIHLATFFPKIKKKNVWIPINYYLKVQQETAVNCLFFSSWSLKYNFFYQKQAAEKCPMVRLICEPCIPWCFSETWPRRFFVLVYIHALHMGCGEFQTCSHVLSVCSSIDLCSSHVL